MRYGVTCALATLPRLLSMPQRLSMRWCSSVAACPEERHAKQPDAFIKPNLAAAGNAFSDTSGYAPSSPPRHLASRKDSCFQTDGVYELNLDPTASVSKTAVLDACSVGRFVDIGDHCNVGRGVNLMRGALIDAGTTLGSGTIVFPNALVGFAPQDKKFGGGRTCTVVGNDCVIRDGARVERGTENGGGCTVLGDRFVSKMGRSHINIHQWAKQGH